MTSLLEKGGGTCAGIKMLLCENPLPPLDEAIAAARNELAQSNYYTDAYSAPPRRLLSEQLGVFERLIHINAGSELILRQLFARLGKRVHLLSPTYVLDEALNCVKWCTEEDWKQGSLRNHPIRTKPELRIGVKWRSSCGRKQMQPNNTHERCRKASLTG